jgi:uncharacterized protein (TIRG00374 family)
LNRTKIFKFARATLGIVLAFFLLRFVIKSSGIDPVEVWTTVDRRFLLAAFVTTGFGLFLAAYRWYILLHHIKVFIPLSVVVRLALIGQFFNLFVPGGVGGDLIKMVYLKKEAGERFPEAVLTVLLDRVLGLLGLLLLALIALVLNPSILENSDREMQAILLVVGLAGSAGLGVVAVFLLWPVLEKYSHLWEVFRNRVPEKVVAILSRVVQAFSLLRSSPGTVALLLFMAMCGHLFATFTTMSVAAGLNEIGRVSFQEFLLVTQLGNLVGAVPLTPGGIGGRDLALAFLLKLSGATDAASGGIPLVGTAVLIVWSTLGGFALLWERKAHASHPPQTSQRATEE